MQHFYNHFFYLYPISTPPSSFSFQSYFPFLQFFYITFLYHNCSRHMQSETAYFFKCGLCDADYVGFTSRHLHQRVEEHKRSAIGNHVKDEHGQDPETIKSNFRILRKCQSKLDCLIFEMLFIRDLKPKLNKQCDSIRAKLFV